MTTDRADIEAELVLIAFVDACPAPSEADVAEWSERYPSFANAIAARAASIREETGSNAQIEQILTAERQRRDEAFAKAKATVRAAKASRYAGKWERGD